MVKELIIHVGDTKTGSTSIQQSLVQEAFKIDGKSYHFSGRSTHNHLAHVLQSGFDARAQRADFNPVTEALDASDADYGIVSAENFQFVEPEVLQKSD